MVSKLQIASVSSTIVETYYEKLRQMSFNLQESDAEYDITVDKLKKCVQGEEQIYHELTDKEISEGLAYFKENGMHSSIDGRVNYKINEIYRERKYRGISVELGNMIASKVMIDVLKNVTNKLLALNNKEIPEEDIDTLFLYHEMYKYHCLTTNKYIEKLALEARFCILALPTIDFKQIESSFNVFFIENSTQIAYNYIIASIQELLKLHSEDKYLNVYLTLFETSRVEIMLPYLNKEYLIKLTNYLNGLNIKEEDASVRRIRKLINKRKEELF